MARKRMSKKELKQPDEILTYMGRMTAFIVDNQMKLAILTFAIIAIISAGFGYKSYVTYRETKENNLLWKILAQVPDNSLSLTEEETKNLVLIKSRLEDFSKDINSKSVSLYTRYYLAEIDYRLGYYTNAVEQFSQIIHVETISDEMRFISAIGLAYCHEALGNYSEAITSYENARDVAIDSYNRASALYGMARCYELMGNDETARQVYTDIIEKNPDYLDIEFIKIRLSSIS